MLAFDRFTTSAQDIAARAYALLQQYGHDQVDTAHILLALLEQPEGIVPRMLEKLSVEQAPLKQRLNDVLSAIPRAKTPERGPEGQVFITEGVKRTLELADEDARRTDAEHISTEHIFLAMLSEPDSAAAGILAEAGITPARVQQILQDS